MTTHFSTFAVIANLTPPSEPEPAEPTPAIIPPAAPEPSPPPAHFVTGALSIQPSQKVFSFGDLRLMVRQGENVTVSTTVTNDGGQVGTYEITLKLNDITKYTKEIILEPGQTQEVVIPISDNEPGQYSVSVNDLTGEFTVVKWTNWWLIGGLIGALALLCSLIWYFRFHRQKRQDWQFKRRYETSD